MYYVIVSLFKSFMVIFSEEEKEVIEEYQDRILFRKDTLEDAIKYLKWHVDQAEKQGVIPFIPDDNE